ncbi:GNAT family N-acetyltransferase [Neobacillus niacini]|nr:GNAT family N-acetyltransferase [Neobacillus niacini]
MQFYIYEFSQYIPSITLEENGAYKPFDLTLFWERPNHHAFFIKKDNELIGFALVESATETEPNAILEFFIVRKYAGNGYGKIAATEIFNMFSGKWHITQIEKNEPAKAFWRRTISQFTGGSYTETTDDHKRTFKSSKRCYKRITGCPVWPPRSSLICLSFFKSTYKEIGCNFYVLS